MGSSRTIITQNDLLALNAALEQLASNLKIHVNQSMSFAHGINAKIANYYDGVGDQWGNAVIIFEFGTPPDVIRLYVPAQLTALGPARTSNGLISSPLTPSGSFTSPGIPLSVKPLVTELTSESVNQAVIYDNLLLAHANTVHSDTGANQCHGGRAYTTGVIADSLGHSLGRKFITLGINGTGWTIPCDEHVDGGNYGPPQLIRGVNLLSNISLRHNSAFSARDDTQLATFFLTPSTGGTLPYTIQFQINNSADGSNPIWTSMGSPIPPLPAPGNQPTIAPSGYPVRFDASTANTLKMQTDIGSDSQVLSATIRALITNSGGTYITNYARFYGNDMDGGLCSDPDESYTTGFVDIPGSPPLQP
jgi:hypothetical protein